MQARDLFGVALRILGIWFLVQAGLYAVFLAMRLTGQTLNAATPMVEEKLLIGFYLAIGFILLAATDKIIRLFYGR